MKTLRIVGTLVAILALTAISASAQPIISAKSGVIANVEGRVFLDNAAIESSVTHFPEIKENSVLRTEDGRAEVLLPPGFVLRLGENGAIKMLTNRLIDTRVELQAGSAVLEVDENNPDTNVTIALGSSQVRLAKSGVYRFDSNPARVKVFHGTAMATIGEQSFIVATGKMLSLGGTSAQLEKFDTEETDALDHWSRRRAESMAMANVSAAKYVNDTYGKMGTSSWGFNPYFGIYTYLPMSGHSCNSYYSYCYWSPDTVYQSFFAPQPTFTNFGGSNGGFNPGYSTLAGTSSGTSSTVSASPSMNSAPAVSASSSTSSAAASSSAGHGSAAGGGASGHGK